MQAGAAGAHAARRGAADIELDIYYRARYNSYSYM